ncbi:MAG: YggS family pyridoxal phosphate-dependent enzyme [Bacteroidaceae bacterium]|nr:YggS family pyridoxal phosphate-dependent enzyme [Bacteroidaceae bacterium]
MLIKHQLEQVLDDLPDEVHLVAISKYHPNEAILEAYNAGLRVFGESHVQELIQKQPALPQDIQWHFIGHLQSNKVKYIVPFISLIHSVDSMKLLNEINKQAQKCGRIVDVLMQIYVAQEETKFGFSKEELIETLSSLTPDHSNIRIRGLMCMATNTLNETLIRSEFHYAHTLFTEIKQRFFTHNDSFDQLSMGMSDDYHIAIEEGATMVRIGSRIFGQRYYD